MLKTFIFLKEEGFSLLLVFFTGIIGVLFGYMISNFSNSLIILFILFVLCLMFTGLLVAWVLNKKIDFFKMYIIQDGLKEQYNAFSMIISELEYNIKISNTSLLSFEAWKKLRKELAYFPPHIFEELNDLYSRLEEIKISNIDIDTYRRILLEIDLAGTIKKLKDWKLKIKRRLPYIL